MLMLENYLGLKEVLDGVFNIWEVQINLSVEIQLIVVENKRTRIKVLLRDNKYLYEVYRLKTLLALKVKNYFEFLYLAKKDNLKTKKRQETFIKLKEIFKKILVGNLS